MSGNHSIQDFFQFKSKYDYASQQRDTVYNTENNVENVHKSALQGLKTKFVCMYLNQILYKIEELFQIQAISEDIYDQLSRLNVWKEGFFVKDRAKNSLKP